MNLRDYQQLEQQEQELRRRHDQVAGAIAQVKQELLAQFGFRTAKKARRVLARRLAELAAEEAACQKAVAKFQQELAAHDKDD